jgi:hypothetical protein
VVDKLENEKRERREEGERNLCESACFYSPCGGHPMAPWHGQTSAFSGGELVIAKEVYAFSPVTTGRIHKG